MFQADGADIGHRRPASQALVDAQEVEAAQTGHFGKSAKREIVGQMLPYVRTNLANQTVVFRVVSCADSVMRQSKLEERLTAGAYRRRLSQITIFRHPGDDLVESGARIKDAERESVRRAIPAKGEESRGHRVSLF